MDMISELPKDILQRILYFLSQEEAVQTSVLSKSWRHIGCTRPNLDFSYETFIGKKQDFISVMNDTLQRYYDQKLCVEEFHLRISLGHFFRDFDHESVEFLEKWIPLLTVMGVKKFCLSIRSESSPGCVKLPPVVFGAESLEDLHVRSFSLEQKDIPSILPFKHLKSLTLEKVCIEDEIFYKIISSCTLIETLIINGCIRLRTVKVNDLYNLKKFFFRVSESEITSDEKLCPIEIHPPSLETIDISQGNLWFPEGAVFRNLKFLYLCDVELPLKRLSSCKFPSLGHLKISGWAGLKEIDIFIDAPNIYKFECAQDFVPSISFATTSGEWDSNLCLHFVLKEVTSPWFLKLKVLLKSLSQSKISLKILQSRMNNQFPLHNDDDDGKQIIKEIFNLVQDSGCDKPIVVETLKFRCNISLISSFLNGLFCICRPRNMEYFIVSRPKLDTEQIECLWKILMEREIGKEDELAQLWFRDLEEVRMEIYDKNREEWHPISLSELPTNHQRGYYFIRFALEWRQTS